MSATQQRESYLQIYLGECRHEGRKASAFSDLHSDFQDDSGYPTPSLHKNNT